ncbi:hypothetical protein SO802_010777 [Lithocarpus litseifolius]|uniref:Uncharacterized protein n=1 Tax=Lithocarpus litseifolius TaxID=425828 RepID=A0AAW2DIY9_9ROSI
MEMAKHFHSFCKSGICNSHKKLLEANTIMPKSFVFEDLGLLKLFGKWLRRDHGDFLKGVYRNGDPHHE